MKRNHVWLLVLSLLALTACEPPPVTAELTTQDGSTLSLECAEIPYMDAADFTGGGMCNQPQQADYDMISVFGYTDGERVEWQVHVANVVTETYRCTTRPADYTTPACPSGTVSHNTATGSFTFTDLVIPSTGGLPAKVLSGTLNYFQG
ncbi:MAG: hypothetical protein OEX12_15760 [Gammaproteobacteria bacterium]|nr:hypothetical protein [Gammaproteobacteria bacterium]